MNQRITDAPIGYLTRFKSQVEEAEKCFPGEPHDYLLTYTHGTKDMERFAAFPDIEVVPIHSTRTALAAIDAALRQEQPNE